MKVTIINGNQRHGSTWHCTDLLLQELAKYDEIEKTEYTLPNAMPHFCKGCFSCFYNGENTCPHAEFTAPVIKAMEDADLLIMTSPVYGMDVSGQMKTLLDHLCFMWMSHRPNPGMFNKVALTVVTTAGAGAGHTTKTMTNSLKFWGVKKIFSYKKPAAAMKWSEVPPKKLEAITRETAELARRVAKAVKNVDKLPNPTFRSFLFKIMSGMHKGNTWNLRDKEHWESKGWLSGTVPFKKSRNG